MEQGRQGDRESDGWIMFEMMTELIVDLSKVGDRRQWRAMS